MRKRNLGSTAPPGAQLDEVVYGILRRHAGTKIQYCSTRPEDALKALKALTLIGWHYAALEVAGDRDLAMWTARVEHWSKPRGRIATTAPTPELAVARLIAHLELEGEHETIRTHREDRRHE